MTRELTKDDAIHAVYGGCVLGGGGGGWISDGLKKAEEIFKIGNPTLIPIEELKDKDYVACVALVGAPSAEDIYLDTQQMIDTIKRIQKESSNPIKAIMTNENGASTSINGWLQAAATGLPFLDAPCNGRAHPTGSMGSLNLTEREDYTSIQAFAGGNEERKVEGVITASLDIASDAVRAISVDAGGMVAVCRNPIDIAYVKEHAAIGGISQAIELGEVLLKEPEGMGRINAICRHLHGEVIESGVVHKFELSKSGGFDVGSVHINDLELTIWNEYMTAEDNGNRVGTFPDLIMTFDTKTGLPIVSAEMKEGIDVTVINVPKEHLLLSTTMYNSNLLKKIEPIINRKIV